MASERVKRRRVGQGSALRYLFIRSAFRTLLDYPLLNKASSERMQYKGRTWNRFSIAETEWEMCKIDICDRAPCPIGKNGDWCVITKTSSLLTLDTRFLSYKPQAANLLTMLELEELFIARMQDICAQVKLWQGKDTDFDNGLLGRLICEMNCVVEACFRARKMNVFTAELFRRIVFSSFGNNG